jgi:hypothetical protein
MTGIISPSMPVFIVKNEATGHVAYATQNEGLGKVLRYGAYSPEVIERLRWMEQALYPTLKAAIESLSSLSSWAWRPSWLAWVSKPPSVA